MVGGLEEGPQTSIEEPDGCSLPDRSRVGADRKRRTGSEAIWDSFIATNKSNRDLSADRQLESSRVTKAESKVRYLGIEVDDALAIAEQVDV